MTTDNKTLADVRDGWPEYLMVRDTGLADDMGGLGQRIFTTAGAGYVKQKYVRADLAECRTLADVQPGGRVRLGDGPTIEKQARELLAAEHRKCDRNTEADLVLAGDVTVLGQIALNAIIAALSAQPSSGGQGVWPFVESPGEFTERLAAAMQEFDLLGAVRHVLIEKPPALAARQPVGQEPVAHEYTFAGLGKRDSVAFVGPEYKPAAPKGMQLVAVRPLYRQPAQAVDLGQFREAVAEWRSNWANYGRTMTSAGRDTSKARRNVDEADRLLALIDSKAVGNG